MAIMPEFSEIEGGETLFSLKLPISPVAKCEDSLALPPFPQKKIVFPCLGVSENKSEAFSSFILFSEIVDCK